MAISKTVKTVLFVLGGIVGLFLLGLIALSLALGSANAPHVGKNSVLVLRVTGEISDYRPEDPTIDLFNMPSPTSLEMLTTQLRKARVDERIEVNDDQVLGVIEKMIKQRKDSITQFEAGGRQDLADIEKAELVVLAAYMPAALSEAEVQAEVAAAIAAVGAAGPQDMGKVMGVLKPKLAGRADMTAVSSMVKAALSK